MRLVPKIANIRRLIRVALLGFAVVWNLSNASGFTFTPGHLYGTGNTRDIIEYSETGAVLGSLTVPSLITEDELLGIVFGSDGFLYAVKANPYNVGFSVLVLDSSGTVHNTYTYTNVYFDYDSYGKIALDQQYIYVAGGTCLFRFTLGDPSSGLPIYYNLGFGIFDVKTLPNGHLFVAYAYGVDEITNTGAIVRSIPLIGGMGQFFVDVRGIEYDPAINKLFATQLGTSFFSFPLMRIDASTGVLENHVYFVYGDDLFLTRSNTLLVGSQSQAPAIYDENLTFIAQLGIVQRAFVTQCPTIGPPTVATNPVTNVGISSATLNGTVDPNGLVTAVHFEYGTTTNYGSSTATQSYFGNMVNNVIANLGSLSAGATYHFRIVGTNAAGTTYGADRSFTTLAAKAVVADFNGDGTPDLVVQRTSTHQTVVLYLNNNVVSGAAVGPTLPVGLSLAGAADFNGDGHPDYALFNSATGRTAIVYLSGVTVVGAAAGPSLSPGWELVGTADFNGDGHPDYVLYKPSTHETAIWYLNNNVFVSSTSGPTLPSGWNLAAVADFNGDGHPDYALFNSVTGQTLIGYLSGGTIIGAAFGPTLAGGWPLVATADFNQDGHPDYLLYNPVNRQTAIGYLNNNVLVNAALGPTLPAGWSLIVP